MSKKDAYLERISLQEEKQDAMEEDDQALDDDDVESNSDFDIDDDTIDRVLKPEEGGAIDEPSGSKDKFDISNNLELKNLIDSRIETLVPSYGTVYKEVGRSMAIRYEKSVLIRNIAVTKGRSLHAALIEHFGNPTYPLGSQLDKVGSWINIPGTNLAKTNILITAPNNILKRSLKNHLIKQLQDKLPLNQVNMPSPEQWHQYISNIRISDACPPMKMDQYKSINKILYQLKATKKITKYDVKTNNNKIITKIRFNTQQDKNLPENWVKIQTNLLLQHTDIESITVEELLQLTNRHNTEASEDANQDQTEKSALEGQGQQSTSNDAGRSTPDQQSQNQTTGTKRNLEATPSKSGPEQKKFLHQPPANWPRR